ncbi:hypothetical protein DI392_00330 [Vibrio albus]|uniref:Peptidoglycan binding-like domain-containing protein n=1 Tax=Vibrio albus TaxID=2200953 RepID=A0A2U3BD96_9VIBR|nr:peptidoglycan-binding protein [Vibrio albus]PWI34766.1 hypothetical protein DI392_00330 [Vibrio albus]
MKPEFKKSVTGSNIVVIPDIMLSDHTAMSNELRASITTSCIVIIAVLLLVPVVAQADSWSDTLKNTATEMLKENQRKRLNGSNNQTVNVPAKKEQLKQVDTLISGNNLRSHQIKRVQWHLQKLGYDPGPADGLMGQKTSNAIKQFERDSDLPITGLPSPRVLVNMELALQQIRKSAQGDGVQYTPSQIHQITTPEGDFARAKSFGECTTAYSQCRTVSQNNYCEKQMELCNNQLKIALSDAQIEQEVQTVLSQCQAQSLSNLYDCQCKANEYRSYRRGNRMADKHYDPNGHYDTGFYQTNWAPRCYKQDEVVQREYKSCMVNIKLNAPAQALIRQGKTDEKTICQCEAEEFSRLQASTTKINSYLMQQYKAKALSYCMK